MRLLTMHIVGNLQLGFKKCRGIRNGAIVLPNQELQLAGNNPVFFRDRVILTVCYDIVSEFNESLLTKLPGDVHTSKSVDSVNINEDGAGYIPQKFSQSQTPSGLPPSRLNLKVGAIIILLRNS